MSHGKLSYLTQRQEVAMVFSRFLRDVDALKHLMAIWKRKDIRWNVEFHMNIYQHHTDNPSVIDRHFLLFDIQHFYPKFLARLNYTSRAYEDMPIRGKIKLLKDLNSDKETISMRRKSIYLFQRNRVDESRTYPVEHMVHQNSSEYLVGITSYRGSFG